MADQAIRARSFASVSYQSKLTTITEKQYQISNIKAE